MVIKLGNREKIVIGSIITIFVIAALHFFIFSPRARKYTEVKSEWKKATENYQRLRNINPSLLDKYIEETKKYEEQLQAGLKDFKLEVPKIYLERTKPENLNKIREIRRELVRELMRLQKESKVSLRFLGPEGWDFPRELPEDIVKNRVNLWDIISRMASVHRIIEISKDSPTVRVQKEREYEALKRQLGIDVNKLEEIKVFGAIVPDLKLMAHAELILNQKPQEYKITVEELYKQLGIIGNFEKGYYVNRQLEFWLDIIARAEKDKIDEIVRVDLFDYQTVYEKATEGAIPPEATPGAPPSTPSPAARVVGEEEYIMRRAGVGRGMPPGEVSPEFWEGMPGEFMMVPEEPREVEKPILTLMPIRIRYKASNLNSSRFLYELTHCPASYEIDDLAIRSIAEANVEVIATINIVASVAGVIVTLEEGGK